MNKDNSSPHPVFNHLEQLNQVILSDKFRNKADSKALVYLDTAIEFIKDRFKIAFFDLLQNQELSAISTELEQSRALLESFSANNNASNLNQAQNLVAAVLNKVKLFPIPSTRGDFDFSKSVLIFQNTQVAAYESLEKKQKDLLNQLKSLGDELIQKNAAIENLQKQLLEKEAEIKSIIVKKSNEIDNTVKKSQNDFESFVNKNKTELDHLKKEYTTSLEEDRNNFRNEANKQGDTAKAESATLLEKLNEKLQEARSIVNIVGDIGVTSNFRRIADDHKWNANIFRWIAIGIMAVLTVFLIWSIIDLSNQDFRVDRSLLRILAAAILTYPSIYASRESSKHRKLETYNRNMELELASIGPFIELLPEDQKQKIKQELVQRYFGNSNKELDEKPGDEIPVNGLERILKAIVPLVAKK